MSDIIMPKPLPMEGLVDCHCHCDYSIDATGTIEQFCEAALQRNLAEICFTTHFDANPHTQGDIEYIRVKGQNLPTTVENLAPYVDDVRAAADKFYPRGLSVKLGIEIGWYRGCEEIVAEMTNRYNFDYLLCGIHELDNICFCSRHGHERFFARFNAEQVAEKYFTEVIAAARTDLFDTIAHLAYYLRSGIEYYSDSILDAHRPYLQDTFDTLIATETGIEINTSALRHGLKDYYPPVKIINAARKAGVDVNFLGSDAHSPEQVGFDFEAASALVPDPLRGCEE
ncbi:MAG: histidinol-phosphatase HisJ family protein [Candidatus Zixiibacteriota bacterium]|nr:MAG: histidinol-phosphatase HisJ family protein [candidate division Zixibacteria bacterium]